MVKEDDKIKIKDYAGALKEYDLAIQLEPDWFEGYTCRAWAKEEIGDYVGALEDLTRSIEYYDFVSNDYHRRGKIKEKLGDYAGSAADFHKALMINIYCEIDFFFRKPTTIFKKSTISKFTTIIDNIPLEIEPILGAVACYYRGKAKCLQEDYSGALEDFENCLRLNPQHRVALNACGVLYFKKGLHTKALKNFNNAISIKDSYDDVDTLTSQIFSHTYSDHCDFYYLVSKKRHRLPASNEYIDYSNKIIHYNRAITKLALGQQKLAINDFQKAEKLGVNINLKADLEPII